MSGLWFDLVLVGFLVGVNALLAGAEMAFISLREGQLQRFSAAGPRERSVARMARDPNSYLGAVQLGITLAGFLASATVAVSLSEPVAKALSPLGSYATPVAVAGVTLGVVMVSLVLGELVPKRLAMQKAESWSLAAVGPLLMLIAITRPLLYLLGLVTDILVRIAGGDPSRHRDRITDEEIVDLVDAQLTLTETQRQIMGGAIEIADRTLRHVLVPRTRVISIDVALPVQDALIKLRQSGHSRAPVVRDQLDNTIGQVHLRDLIDPGGVVSERFFPILAMPETVSVLEALHRFQVSHTELAVVIDEHGGTAGIVTIEDLLEELVGEIYDETDEGLLSVERNETETLLLPGSFPIHELIDLGVALPLGPYVTIAGLVVDKLGRLAVVGDKVILDFHEIRVTAMDQQSIDSVRLTVIPSENRPSG